MLATKSSLAATETALDQARDGMAGIGNEVSNKSPPRETASADMLRFSINRGTVSCYLHHGVFRRVTSRKQAREPGRTDTLRSSADMYGPAIVRSEEVLLPTRSSDARIPRTRTHQTQALRVLRARHSLPRTASGFTRGLWIRFFQHPCCTSAPPGFTYNSYESKVLLPHLALRRGRDYSSSDGRWGGELLGFGT